MAPVITSSPELPSLSQFGLLLLIRQNRGEDLLNWMPNGLTLALRGQLGMRRMLLDWFIRAIHLADSFDKFTPQSRMTRNSSGILQVLSEIAEQWLQ